MSKQKTPVLLLLLLLLLLELTSLTRAEDETSESVDCVTDDDCQHGICRQGNDNDNGGATPLPYCWCDTGFYGRQCELVCPIRCANGGQCVIESDEHGGLPEASTFICVCPPSNEWTGHLCNDPVVVPPASTPTTQVEEGGTVVVVCRSDDDCQNGGTCQDYGLSGDHADVAAASCHCATGFYGEQCENSCSLRCANGGHCKAASGNGNFVCECSGAEWTGNLCNIPVIVTNSASANDNADNDEQSIGTLGIVMIVLVVAISAVLALSIVVMRSWRYRKSSKMDTDCELPSGKGQIAVANTSAGIQCTERNEAPQDDGEVLHTAETSSERGFV